MKLLLHTCCGPCFLGVWEELGTHSEILTTLYYDNDNIYPETEWEKRQDNLLIVAKDRNVPIIVTNYNSENYGKSVTVKTTKFPARCIYCYKMRLGKVAKHAKENGFDAISTTLFVSPYQQHEELINVAQDVAADYGVDLYYTDWRPYFREGQKEAKEMCIYRQRYCGCKLSLAESKIKIK